jgi:murein DD-endopeptidase MepM/ murein hydrolase activator NlpD
MSIVRRPAARMLSALLLLTVIVAPGQWPAAVRATDPLVNEAIDEQARMERELARQQAQLADLQRDQADLAENLRGVATELDAVGMEIEAAVRELELATRRLEAAQGALRAYQLDIDHLEETLARLATELATAKVELVEREALLEEHLRLAYEQSQTSILEILISTDSFTRATSELSYMITLSEEDRLLAAEVRDRRHMLEVRRDTLSVGRETLSELRDEAAERAAALAVQQQEVDAARVALEEKQKVLLEMQDAMDKEFQSTTLSVIERRQAIADGEAALLEQSALVEQLKELANQLDIAYRGRFAWPERGSFVITQEFGWTSFNPNHTGIDMAYTTQRCGMPIYAAGDGIVLADGKPNSQWGDPAIGVVVGHSQHLLTWYWHLSAEIVAVGQEVHTGDVIGYEGATGWATGCHLHFGVTFDGVPVNPRSYLP